jgi:hypothetical protein
MIISTAKLSGRYSLTNVAIGYRNVEKTAVDVDIDGDRSVSVNKTSLGIPINMDEWIIYTARRKDEKAVTIQEDGERNTGSIPKAPIHRLTIKKQTMSAYL